MSGEALELRGVRRAYGTRVVLDDVDLQVEAGRSLVLLGSSGAGKTTLLRIVAGLDEAQAGSVRLGERVLSDPGVRVPPEARRIGMVFQALELWPQMSVAEHLAFALPGRPRGHAAASHPRVLELARQVGLPAALLGRRPGTLSGGEQQRTAIARTLAADPEVMLYDEPLANLDPDRRRTLRQLIRRLATEHGTTLVYVTHDPEEALEIGDELAVMESGRILERGAPQDLYRHPHSLAAARALGPVTALAGECDGRQVHTVLGTHDLEAGRAPGPCLVLWRPEAVRVEADGPVRVRVEDVVARGPDWAVRASCQGAPLLARSSRAPRPGEEVTVRAQAPAAVLDPLPERMEVPA